MEKRKQMEKVLKELGICTIEDLNRAIKEEAPLNLSLMVGEYRKEKQIA